MSSIFSDLVADVLLERCGLVSDSEKHLIGAVLGVSPTELYTGCIAHADGTCAVRTGKKDDDHWEMRAIVLENGVIVIPYLVVHDGAGGSADPNRGNRGFNG